MELNLDDDGTLIDSISEKRGGDETKCCLDVLKAWLQGKGEEPKTWRTLVGCLREIKAEDAVRSIEENILQSSKCIATKVSAIWLVLNSGWMTGCLPDVKDLYHFKKIQGGFILCWVASLQSMP